ncbi:MAG: response regulator transcription factor [Ktedonobacterales bacterium]
MTSSASQGFKNERGHLVEIHAPTHSHQTQTSGRTAKRHRSRREANPRHSAVKQPHWGSPVPAIGERESLPRSHASVDGALALLDIPEIEALPTPRATPVRHRILIVEDDQRVANVIRETLELEGDPDWTIETASEGQHALELAGIVQPDVILLDVRLPGLDGAEVYRRLRASQNSRRSRVLFLSAGTSLDLYHRGIEDGVLLRKPFDVRELVSLVRALLVK